MADSLTGYSSLLPFMIRGPVRKHVTCHTPIDNKLGWVSNRCLATRVVSSSFFELRPEGLSGTVDFDRIITTYAKGTVIQSVCRGHSIFSVSVETKCHYNRAWSSTWVPAGTKPMGPFNTR